MANFIVNNFHYQLLLNGINIQQGGEPVYVSLHDNTFNGNDEDVNVGDVTTLGELSGTGYTPGFGGTGRKQLANVAITLDNPNDEAVYDADDITWVSIDAGTINWVGMHVRRTSDADSPNLWYFDRSGDPKTTNGGNMTLQFAAAGIYRLGRRTGS